MSAGSKWRRLLVWSVGLSFVSLILAFFPQEVATMARNAEESFSRLIADKSAIEPPFRPTAQPAALSRSKPKDEDQLGDALRSIANEVEHLREEVRNRKFQETKETANNISGLAGMLFIKRGIEKDLASSLNEDLEVLTSQINRNTDLTNRLYEKINDEAKFDLTKLVSVICAVFSALAALAMTLVYWLDHKIKSREHRWVTEARNTNIDK